MAYFTTSIETQLSFTPRKRFTRHNAANTNICALAADTNVYSEGTVLKAGTVDGTVDIATAADVPLGIIIVGASNYLGKGQITYQAQFVGLMTGVASAAVAAGQEVKQTGSVTLASTEVAPSFAPAATGDWVVGLATSSQSVVNGDFQFLFQAPHKKS